MKHQPMIMTKRSTNISVFIWVLIAIFLGSLYTFHSDVKLYLQKDSPQQGYNGVVASENALCSEIGVDILKKGGSAVDSVIATGICIGTTNMHSSGIGGGGFLVVRTKNDQLSFNFREKAPKGSYTDMYKEDPHLAQVGGLSVGVPGELKGYQEAHKRFGKLPWKDLIQPSIDLSRRGWIITSHFAKRIGMYAKEIENDPVMGRVLAPNGTILKAGDWMNRPVYANTLESIANEGADVFYTGWIAKELVNTVQKHGGILTMEDMADYDVEVDVPLVGTYRDMQIITSPPPASGAVLLTILNILEQFELKEQTPLNYHRIMEAFKHGYAQRGFYGDPSDPIFRNISQIVKHFTQKEVGVELAKRIAENTTFPVDYYKPEFKSIDNHGTMHVSVLTKDGEACSLTSTVNLILGSRVMDDKTGIVLNDEMDDFSIPGVSNAFGLAPSPYNFIHPHKRPLSSSVPTIVEKNGQVVAVAGASGGSHIITSTLQTLVKMLDFGYDAYDAVHDPRGHHQLIPHNVWLEHATRKDIIDGLLQRNHQVVVAEEGVSSSGVAAIKRHRNGLLSGAGDARKNGMAFGY